MLFRSVYVRMCVCMVSVSAYVCAYVCECAEEEDEEGIWKGKEETAYIQLLAAAPHQR